MLYHNDAKRQIMHSNAGALEREKLLKCAALDWFIS